MFGGCGQECPSNETWVYGACGTIISSKDCSSMLGGQVVWFNETGINPAPTARTNAAFGYDYQDFALVLFGGLNANGTVLGDTWTFSGAWTHVTNSVQNPPAREEARHGRNRWWRWRRRCHSFRGGRSNW